MDLLMSFGLTAFESSALLRMLLASVCGAAIGLEREMKGRPAGLKTFSLVCLGATLVMITNDYICKHVANGTGDLSRMAAQVISGVGFLGAGSIMVTSHNRVRGLTTAAALWVTAALGIAIGAGFYFGGIAGLCIIYTSSFFYRFVDRKIMERSKSMVLYVEGENEQFLFRLVMYLHDNQIKVTSLKRKAENKWYTDDTCATLTLQFTKRMLHREILENIRWIEGYHYAEEV